MTELHEFMTADGLQKLVKVNLGRVAFVTREGAMTLLHFSAVPDDFLPVIDFEGHLDEESNG